MILDIENTTALHQYLIENTLIPFDAVPHYQALTGGVANRTILVTQPDGTAFVVKQALARFRVDVEWYADPRRSHREVLGLQAFYALAPTGTVPSLLFEDEDSFLHIIEAIPQPHRVYKEMLLAGQGTPELATRCGTLLATFHMNALAHREQLAPVFSDLTHFESQRLEPFYTYTAAQVPAAAEFIHRLTNATRQTFITLVHGDFTPKNILVRGNGSLVLLDYEIVHWGDPAFDVGLALAHFVAKAILRNHARDTAWQEVTAFVQAYNVAASAVFPIQALLDKAFAHFLVCLLARVRGRSPLNYLATVERQFIEQRVVQLMSSDRVGIRQLGAFVPDL